ncbi:MAG: RICIN domain-containing protein [Clostridia bacterium]
MKKITSLLLCLVLCFSLAFSALANVKITVDGAEVKQVNEQGDPVPEVDTADNVIVPIRAVLKAMGYFIGYDEETGLVSGGTKADPEFIFTPGENNTTLVDGTTFIDGGELTEKNGLAYTAEYKDGVLEYTNTYTEIQEGYYRISYVLNDAKYLTGEVLPAENLVETVIDDEGNETEKVTTPQNQIRAKGVVIEDKKDSDTQLWLIKKLKDKTYVIINKNNGLSLDVNSWSMDDGASIIQYTFAGGTNQQWLFKPSGIEKTEYEIYSVLSKLAIGSIDGKNVSQGLFQDGVWALELIEPYTNPVELAPTTEAFKELDPYYQERFNAYFFTDVDFSVSANAKAEIYLRENDFVNADKETQKELILGCLSITYSDLLGGSMRTKLTAEYTIHEPVREIIGEGEGAKNYYVYNVDMECSSPEDIHTFQVYTIDEDDLEHVERVVQAVACYEPPVRKTLRHFFYTGDKFGTWNAWDGEVWNNTGGKSSVDGMLNMFSHELGHVIDSYFKCGDDVWRRAINADIIPTSGYGQTNRWEDFGEFSRLYLLSRGDESRMAAIEKIYPNRTETYRAALYNLDSEYYAEYKDCYDKVTAPIGDTSEIDGEQYYTISADGGVLTNSENGLTIAEDTKSDNQLWQIVVSDTQLAKLYCKADGKAVVVPSVAINTAAEASIDGSAAIGILPVDGGYKLTISETGFGLTAKDGRIIATLTNDTVWALTPVEKVSGMGKFTIKSGGKYLVPSTEERGARLVLSDSADMSVWYVNKLPNNVGYITNTANDFAIDINGASEDEGASALTYTLSRNANQMWLIETNENGTVSFKAQHSGLYLAVDDEGKAIQSAEKYEWTMTEAE